MLAVTAQRAFEVFTVAFITATAFALVAAVVSAIRYARRMDRTAHGLSRWARRAGRQIGLPFPLDDEDEDNNGF